MSRPNPKMGGYAEIIQAFLHGNKPRRHNSLFVEDGVLYSYGYHFPLLRRHPNHWGVLLLNSDSYSVTTGTQQSAARIYLSTKNYDYIECEGADWRKIQKKHEEWFANIKKRLGNPRCRIDRLGWALRLLHCYVEERKMLQLEPELLEGMEAEEYLNKLVLANDKLYNRVLKKKLFGN